MAHYVSTPDRLNAYPRAPRDDPNAHRPFVDPTIRGVRFEEPRRQVKQHPPPRTEATSSSVVSRNHSFRLHNLLKNTAVTPPELPMRCNRLCPRNPGRTGVNEAKPIVLQAHFWTLPRQLWCTSANAIGRPFFEPVYRRWLSKSSMPQGGKCAADCTLLDSFSITLRP